MSRMSIEKSIDLISTIKDYKQKNTLKNNATKEVKRLGDTIKEEFNKQELKEFDADGVIAKITEVEKVSFNEDYALEVIKEKYPEIAKKVIQTREYVNEDLLEAEIYNNKDFAKEIKKAFTTKIEVRLNVK